ncbi:CDKN2AIP N-terminal-like protein isoform X2 [Gambusia affinis]|uniref:CDKN2AIP N-terminal-like protein isoform X2 n=1 Tax=Gambusia affinis TaxID=33528 RepID=UPI001CDC3673|nr:CDKN2AIP N-terminal-like protein isoform X2 [Gambusia affinis]
MSALDVQDFIQQNRATAQQVETFRGYWESDKHWDARREFILRNMSDFEADRLDHLLSLSMVWANNVFMGCRCVATDPVCLLTAATARRCWKK